MWQKYFAGERRYVGVCLMIIATLFFCTTKQYALYVYGSDVFDKMFVHKLSEEEKIKPTDNMLLTYYGMPFIIDSGKKIYRNEDANSYYLNYYINKATLETLLSKSTEICLENKKRVEELGLDEKTIHDSVKQLCEEEEYKKCRDAFRFMVSDGMYIYMIQDNAVYIKDIKGSPSLVFSYYAAENDEKTKDKLKEFNEMILKKINDGNKNQTCIISTKFFFSKEGNAALFTLKGKDIFKVMYVRYKGEVEEYTPGTSFYDEVIGMFFEKPFQEEESINWKQKINNAVFKVIEKIDRVTDDFNFHI